MFRWNTNCMMASWADWLRFNAYTVEHRSLQEVQHWDTRGRSAIRPFISSMISRAISAWMNPLAKENTWKLWIYIGPQGMLMSTSKTLFLRRNATLCTSLEPYQISFPTLNLPSQTYVCITYQFRVRVPIVTLRLSSCCQVGYWYRYYVSNLIEITVVPLQRKDAFLLWLDNWIMRILQIYIEMMFLVFI